MAHSTTDTGPQHDPAKINAIQDRVHALLWCIHEHGTKHTPIPSSFAQESRSFLTLYQTRRILLLFRP